MHPAVITNAKEAQCKPQNMYHAKNYDTSSVKLRKPFTLCSTSSGLKGSNFRCLIVCPQKVQARLGDRPLVSDWTWKLFWNFSPNVHTLQILIQSVKRNCKSAGERVHKRKRERKSENMNQRKREREERLAVSNFHKRREKPWMLSLTVI